MRWSIFIVMAAIALTMDQAFFHVLAVGNIFPGICGTLVVFVALFAPRLTALWAAMIVGLMLDLGTASSTTEGVAFHVLGPHALGLVLGVYLVLLLRSVVVRRNPFTVGMLVFPCLVAMGLFSMGIWSLRDLYTETLLPWGDTSATGELGRVIGGALYSAVLGIPIGWLLLLSWNLWRFDPVLPRGSRR